MVLPGHGGQRRRQLRRRQRHDPDARGLRRHPAGMPRRPRGRPGRPCPHAGRLRQPQLGARRPIYGTTPAFLDVRDWTDLAEGEAFTDRDVRNASKVCLLGQTLVARTLPGRVAHRQGNPRQERLVPGRRRAGRQGRQHDGHGPGRHPPGALDHHQVPRRRLVGSATPTRAPAARSASTVNTLSQLYPDAPRRASIPRQSDIQAADTPAARAVRQRRPDPGRRPEHAEEIPPAIAADHRRSCASGTASARAKPDDFNIRDMTEMTKTLTSTTDADDQRCCCAWP